jgi:hypothetical protein
MKTPFITVLLATLFTACQEKPENAFFIIPSAASEITIDGKLSEPAWKKAAHTGPFRRFDGRADAGLRTEAHLTWNPEFLYLAFECEDKDVGSRYIKRDDPLYLQEAVEIFVDPDSDQVDYMEFEVSPRGILFDASFEARRKGMKLSFNPASQVGVVVDGTLNQPGDQDKAWTVELAVPFKDMTGRGRMPPEPGDRWRMNLFRLDKSHGTQQASSWKPTAGDFHDLNAFGVVQFR